MTENKGGRPPVPAEEKLHPVSTRLNADEIAILDQLIKDGFGDSRSEVLRNLVINLPASQVSEQLAGHS